MAKEPELSTRTLVITNRRTLLTAKCETFIIVKRPSSLILRKENGTNGNSSGQPKSKELKAGQAAPSGKGCPACNCFVYHADQVFTIISTYEISKRNALQIFSKDQVYHKQCFKCVRCSRFLDSRIACDGPDKKIYCNGKVNLEKEEEKVEVDTDYHSFNGASLQLATGRWPVSRAMGSVRAAPPS